MDARSINAKVREGVSPTEQELRWYARGLANGDVTDAQAAAFAMAVLLNGLTEPSKVALTLAMRDSGQVLEWDLPGPVLDKHSTGGVGDTVSLLLAPALAACGVYVPMISGRGLGHTGGTLDKMEAIPGLNAKISESELKRITREVGCAIVGATGEIAPADKRLYAIRDVSACVESIDLITASILSKKLAAGLEGLVLDVKCGSGAFMKTQDEAEALAQSLVSTAKGAGCKTAAFVTDMTEPLAPTLGNALEVATVMRLLEGDRLAAPRLFDLTVALGGRLLALAGWAEGEGEEMVNEAILSGEAMAHFAKMVAEMGGPKHFDMSWRTDLPKAPATLVIEAKGAGYVREIDGEALGLAVIALGGGRRKETDEIDPRTGLDRVAPKGTPVQKGDPLCIVHAADDTTAQAVAEMIEAAFTIGDVPEITPLVMKRID
ncbi:thymidine phosphorylase [Marivivens sp. LCG002]|uniref:thymidine phosphorylase n=1 Tax=Marivivens sp. LCG002 TaxID=3051171 RepID=UPI0025576A28|nr:thymidine phosphorylase [Marivivens sp. LCG002]WIV51473.1 thymidine phosphorylase [Marivivens sp. LCG002]